MTRGNPLGDDAKPFAEKRTATSLERAAEVHGLIGASVTELAKFGYTRDEMIDGILLYALDALARRMGRQKAAEQLILAALRWHAQAPADTTQ